MANAVDINNLSFEYEEGAKTIDQISFSVPKGSYTVVSVSYTHLTLPTTPYV